MAGASRVPHLGTNATPHLNCQMALTFDVVSQTLCHQSATPVLPGFSPSAMPPAQAIVSSGWRVLPVESCVAHGCFFPAHQETIGRCVTRLKSSQSNTCCPWCMAVAAFWVRVTIRRQWPRMPQIMLPLCSWFLLHRSTIVGFSGPKKETSSFLGSLSDRTWSESFLAEILERVVCFSFVSFFGNLYQRNFWVKDCFSSGRCR